jgi:hypothetical protein
MKSISGSSPPPSASSGGVRCRRTILLSPSRWYLTPPLRLVAEPPGENTWASRIRSAMRALSAPPTKPTATTPSWEEGVAGLRLVEGAGEGEDDFGGGVRESTRTAGEDEGVA